MPTPDAFPPSDPSGDSSNEQPHLPESLAAVDSEMQALLDRLAELNEQRQRLLEEHRALDERPVAVPLPDGHLEEFHEMDDDDERGLPSGGIMHFDELVLLGNEGSEFQDLLVPLTRQVESELLRLVDAILTKRLEHAARVTGLSESAIAAQAGYASAADMHGGIVIDVAKKALVDYLVKHKDVLSTVNIMEIHANVDEALNLQQSLRPVGNKEVLAQMFRFSTRVIFRMTREIIRSEAVKAARAEGKSVATGIELDKACAEYAWSKARRPFDDLLQDVAERLVRETHAKRVGNVDGAIIRHTCRNILQEIVGTQMLRDAGERYEPRGKQSKIAEQLQAELGGILTELRRETTLIQFGARGEKVHLPMPKDDVDFVNSTRVRLMGFDPDGKRMESLEPDMRIFQDLERHLLRWKEGLRGRVGVGGLSKEQSEAIKRFYDEGGHSSAFTKEQIEFIWRHGAIFFIERDVREGFRQTIGSISVLSRTPSTLLDGMEPREGAWEHSDEVLDLFPQYNFADLIPDKASHGIRSSLYQGLAKRILICRSSILSSLHPEVLGREGSEAVSLRRMGFASRLKYETFLVSRLLGSTSLTFNIGTILSAYDGELRGVNRPSAQHNSWANILAWRNYFTKLIDGVDMRWTAYEGFISDGIEEIERPHGLMAGKGWDMELPKRSADANAWRTQSLIDSGDHSPW